MLWELNKTLFVWRMLPPHGGAAGILAQVILDSAHLRLPTTQEVYDESNLTIHTGCNSPFIHHSPIVYVLTNGVRKTADACLWDQAGKQEPQYPEIAIEVAYSDLMTVTKGRVSQWIENTKCQVMLCSTTVTDSEDKAGHWS
jgi:hypothetical protein